MHIIQVTIIIVAITPSCLYYFSNTLPFCLFFLFCLFFFFFFFLIVRDDSVNFENGFVDFMKLPSRWTVTKQPEIDLMSPGSRDLYHLP